jgi:transcriptional antiterminator NusG
MNETESQDLPATGETDSEQMADVVERAEEGDEAAEVALEETSESPPYLDAVAEDEVRAEAEAEVEAEARPEPEDDVTDVPTDEATLLESDAEQELAADTVEGEDEGPLMATGPDRYVQGQADQEVVEVPATEGAEGTPEERKPSVEEVPTASSPYEGPGEWYVVHTYAGYENKVKTNLHSRIGSMQMEDKIFDVVIPMEDVMEIKGGKRQVVQRKVFPGYLMVKMIYDNDSWYVVRNTPGVTGFVSSGTGTKPTPLSRREVEKILTVKEETQAKPTFRLEWEEGDVVRIIAGPFADFTGTIAEINVEQSKLKVLVNIFDRETPVELAFDQVAKA